ncbi:hypothetical protein GL218_03976 [Daldinia childiae]|uniref:uncharacterized protein n=1 Tax=Daldinia childiae TaxID=326645 RepID=UPI0014468529|nr:uncharacterized protein GL218_03976 [Daldinia childiae]KAF3062071.1 hypothetical protein GL218_03976 [Daldinia childiae]
MDEKVLTNETYSLALFIEILSQVPHIDALTSEELLASLQIVDGDTVQAIQALKETRPDPTQELRSILESVLLALKSLRKKSSVAAQALERSERQLHDALSIFYPDFVVAKEQRSDPTPIEVHFVPTSNQIETFRLGSLTVPRLFNGLWQLSSPAWGSASAKMQDDALKGLVEAGLTATDMADHYGDAELVYGAFRNRLSPASVRDKVFAATKWCVFGKFTDVVTPEWVLAKVKERSRRLGGRVELLQLHWHDYSSKEYLDILVELVKLTKERPEILSAVGLCNFDSAHTEEACEYLLSKTGEFSLMDSRPLIELASTCTKYDIKLLTYGSFCGGFLSAKWLDKPVPEIYGDGAKLTPSQRKYFDMISNWGSWAEFQNLLSVLDSTAKKHGVSLANVSTRWVLQQPAVGAVIVGTRLGLSSHADGNLATFNVQLDAEDLEAIGTLALGANGERIKRVYEKLGDCGNEYRAMH